MQEPDRVSTITKYSFCMDIDHNQATAQKCKFSISKKGIVKLDANFVLTPMPEQQQMSQDILESSTRLFWLFPNSFLQNLHLSLSDLPVPCQNELNKIFFSKSFRLSEQLRKNFKGPFSSLFFQFTLTARYLRIIFKRTTGLKRQLINAPKG